MTDPRLGNVGGFDVVVIDPPVTFECYSETSKTRGRRASHHYGLMTWDDLGKLGGLIDAVMADDALNFLWMTNPLMEPTMEMARDWNLIGGRGGLPRRAGQRWIYKTVGFYWVKTNRNGSPYGGLGHYTRSGVEPVFLYRRGKGVERQNKGVKQIVLAPLPKDANGKRIHSGKPEDVQDRIEVLYPNARKLELFARRVRPGWTCLGNEIDGKDIRDALRDLIAERVEGGGHVDPA